MINRGEAEMDEYGNIYVKPQFQFIEREIERERALNKLHSSKSVVSMQQIE